MASCFPVTSFLSIFPHFLPSLLPYFPTLHLSLLLPFTSDGSGDNEEEEGPLSPVIIAVIALTGFFAVVIVILTIAVIILCKRPSARMDDYRAKGNINIL